MHECTQRTTQAAFYLDNQATKDYHSLRLLDKKIGPVYHSCTSAALEARLSEMTKLWGSA